VPRFLATTLACLVVVLLGAPSALANSNIEVVAGNTLTNNAGAPTFAPTAASSQVGADLISGELAAGNDVTLNTASAHAATGTIAVNASITSANAAGDLTLNADDDISQGPGAITLAGNAHVETTVNDNITLTAATNDFTTVSSPDVATLSLRDQNALALGSIETNSNLEIQAGGNLTQTAGSLLDTNHVSLTLGSNDVTLTNAGNDLGGFIANSVDDADFSNSSTGAFQLRGTVSGDLEVTTEGNIFDAEPISVAGTASLNANGTITLDNAADDFSTVVVPNATNVTLVDASALVFGASTISGNLSVNTAGNVTQTGAIAATAGQLTLNVGAANDVTLTNAANDFQSLRATTVDHLNVADASGLTLGDMTVIGTSTVDTAGPITQAGGSSIVSTGAATFDANSDNDITLTGASNNFSSFRVTSADDVAVTDANALVLGASNVGGGLTANASGSITQSGGLTVTGPTALGAGAANDITLNNSANDLSSAGVTSADDVALTDTNALDLAASTIGGGLTTTAGGALTQAGALSVGAATAASGSPVVLDEATNDFTGPVGITSTGGGAAAVGDTNDLTLVGSTSGGSLTATADGDLAVPASATVAATGALQLVADDANATPPAIGDGGVAVGANAALTGAGAVRLYGSRRAENSIAGNATFNGAAFAPGTIFVDTAREQWAVYSPAGTATAPFTFFYKDADTTTPQATITSPVDGATYERGQVVNAEYSCSDGGGGSGVTTCSGTVANGSPIDTSTPGEKTFAVEVVSGSGGQSTSTVTYNVVETPPDPSVEVVGLERHRDEGTATLTVAANRPGSLRIAKTKKVRGFGPVQLGEAGSVELEVVARPKTARKLDRTGRAKVNPRILFAAAGLDHEIGVRRAFKLRLG
jgi:trimeric autotransporter adhesin